GLFPPGLRALVMEHPRTHRHSRKTRRRGPRLMSVAMQDETIDAVTKSPITKDFHAVGMTQPFFGVCGGKGFAANNRFAVDVAGRGHFHATVGHAIRWPGPKLGHGLIDAPGKHEIIAWIQI